MAARAKRKPSGYQLDPSLPYAIYWGSRDFYGKIYLILGRQAKVVGMRECYSILNGLYKESQGMEFLNNWPITASFFSIITEFKTKECLIKFLSKLEIDSSPDGSGSAPQTVSEESSV